MTNLLEQPENQIIFEKNLQETSVNYLNSSSQISSRLTCISPQPQSTAATRLLMNTPQTPNSTLPNSYFGSKTADHWSNGYKSANSSRTNLTPPPSASKTRDEPVFSVEPFTSPFVCVENQNDFIKADNSIPMYVSSPNPRTRYLEFSNFLGGQTSQSSLLTWSVPRNKETGLLSYNMRNPPPGFSILPNDEQLDTTCNGFKGNNNDKQSSLSVNTKFSSKNISINSPTMHSPR